MEQIIENIQLLRSIHSSIIFVFGMLLILLFIIGLENLDYKKWTQRFIALVLASITLCMFGTYKKNTLDLTGKNFNINICSNNSNISIQEGININQPLECKKTMVTITNDNKLLTVTDKQGHKYKIKREDFLYNYNSDFSIKLNKNTFTID